MTQAIASVLGLQETPGHAFANVLVDALRARRLLLILDNCEHLIQACAELVHGLLAPAPAWSCWRPVASLSTSPARSRTTSRPSSAPTHRAAGLVAELCAVEAVRLFAARASAVRADFRVTELNAPAVTRVCTQLDGIPLALELAAARVRALTVEQIAARLDDCFPVLSRGSRTAPPRQQTLEAAVTWSYDLLHPTEQQVLLRLAVFGGPWSLEAAEALCADACPTEPVLDVLARLVEKSLVLAETIASGTPCYRLLETIRQFAHQRLQAEGSAVVDEVRERHFRWYLRLALDSEQVLRFQPRPWARARSASPACASRCRTCAPPGSGRCTARGEHRAGLRLVAALFPFFWSGYLVEGRESLVALLDKDRGSTAVRRARLGPGNGVQADRPVRRRSARGGHGDGVLHATQGAADAHRDGFAHAALGLVALRRGDTATARADISAGLAAARAGGDVQAVPLYLLYLAAVARAAGQRDDPRSSIAGHRRRDRGRFSSRRSASPSASSPAWPTPPASASRRAPCTTRRC